MPVRPFRPNRLLIYLGGIGAGLLFGVGLTGLFVYRESGFASEDDITRVLSVPVLAVIPIMKAGRVRESTASSGTAGAFLEWRKGSREA